MRRQIDYELAHRVRRIGHLDLPGGGQIVVEGQHAYVGHMKPPYGTSIVDVSDPSRPRVVAQLRLEDDHSHTHKVRVVGDIMVVNVEMNRRHFLRKGERLPALRVELETTLGRPPRDDELAAGLGVGAADIPILDAARERGYHDGGFKIYDIADKANPRLIHHERTFGFGVHRFDLDQRFAYISTEMAGFIGNILVIYDIGDPSRPTEMARWWMPGQHVEGGEVPTWPGYSHRLHHAMREGDQLWAAVWHAGIRVLDISDISAPHVIGEYDYHPPFPEPTHTVLPLRLPVRGKRIAVAVDEEHEHVEGQPHGGLWILDVSDLADIRPLSTFHVSELDSPWSRSPGRFGAHQFQEHLDSTLVFCAWFSGGLRIIDLADPFLPRQVGFFVPEPVGGEASPQTNDVDVAPDGLIFTIDRQNGLDVLEFDG